MPLDPTTIVDLQARSPRPGRTPAPVRLVREGPVPHATCPHCAGELLVGTAGARWRVRHPADVADRLMLQLSGTEREELHVLVLDAKNVVISQERLYLGNISSTLVRVGELFAEAVRRNACGVVIVHNHPSGDPTPSPDDLHLTAAAIAAGRLLDIDVLDHVIVGASGWVSLRERGVTFDRAQGPAGAAETRGSPTYSSAGLTVDAGGRVVDASGAVHDLRDAMEALAWTRALKSSGAPHEYTIRGRGGPVLAWEALAVAIRKSPDSYLAFHRGYQRPMRYLETLGWRIWVSSTWNGGGRLLFLNRCDPDSDTPRRVDQGGRPIDWGDSPPWAEYGSPWPPGWVRDPDGRRVYRRELDPRRSYRCAACGRAFFWDEGRHCPSCGTLAGEL